MTSQMSLNINSGRWETETSEWVKQIDQLNNDADTKTALMDSNIIINANKTGLLPATLSIFRRIQLNRYVIFEEIAPSIGNNVRLLLSNSIKNVEIIDNSVSDELNNLSNQVENFHAETSDSDKINAMTIQEDDSSAVPNVPSVNPPVSIPPFIKVAMTEDGKHICQNNKGEEFIFSPHSLTHPGDGNLLYQAATIGRDQVCAFTDERKNIKQDLDDSRIVNYSSWHILLLLIKKTKWLNKDNLTDIYYQLFFLTGICIPKDNFNIILRSFNCRDLSIK